MSRDHQAERGVLLKHRALSVLEVRAHLVPETAPDKVFPAGEQWRGDGWEHGGSSQWRTAKCLNATPGDVDATWGKHRSFPTW